MGSCIFVIDSSPAIRRLVEQAARSQGYEVMPFEDGPSALDDAKRLKPKYIIADYHLDGLTFKTFCDKLSQFDLIPTTSVVLLVNASDRYDEGTMRSRGVTAFLHKPLQPEQVTTLLQGQSETTSSTGSSTGTSTARSRPAWPPETSEIGTEGGTAPSASEEVTATPKPPTTLPIKTRPGNADAPVDAAASAAAAAASTREGVKPIGQAISRQAISPKDAAKAPAHLPARPKGATQKLPSAPPAPPSLKTPRAQSPTTDQPAEAAPPAPQSLPAPTPPESPESPAPGSSGRRMADLVTSESALLKTPRAQSPKAGQTADAAPHASDSPPATRPTDPPASAASGTPVADAATSETPSLKTPRMQSPKPSDTADTPQSSSGTPEEAVGPVSQRTTSERGTDSSFLQQRFTPRPGSQTSATPDAAPSPPAQPMTTGHDMTPEPKSDSTLFLDDILPNDLPIDLPIDPGWDSLALPAGGDAILAPSTDEPMQESTMSTPEPTELPDTLMTQPAEPVPATMAAEATHGAFPPPLEEATRGSASVVRTTPEERSSAAMASMSAEVVAQQVSSQLLQAMQTEVSAHLSAAMPKEQLIRAAEQTVQKELPTLATHIAASIETKVRQHLTDKASLMVEEMVATLVREVAEPAVQKQLPDLLRQHLGPVDAIVKKAAEESVADHAREATERIVREIVEEQVAELLATAVPDIAEKIIKQEIDRLTASS
ncbi:MAG: response regulator [Nitrospirales bacterium]